MVKVSYMPLKCENWSIEGGSGFKVKALINNEAIIYKKELVELSKSNLVEIRSKYHKNTENRKKKLFEKITKDFEKKLEKKKSQEEVSKKQEETMRKKFKKELKEKLGKKYDGSFRRIYLTRSAFLGFRYSYSLFNFIGTHIKTEVFGKLWEEGEIQIRIDKDAWHTLKEAHEHGKEWSVELMKKLKEAT